MLLGKVSSETSPSLPLTVSHVLVAFSCPCKAWVAPLLTDAPGLPEGAFHDSCLRSVCFLEWAFLFLLDSSGSSLLWLSVPLCFQASWEVLSSLAPLVIWGGTSLSSICLTCHIVQSRRKNSNQVLKLFTKIFQYTFFLIYILFLVGQRIWGLEWRELNH